MFSSCEEDQVGPTLNLSLATAPNLTSPSDGTALVFTPATSETVITFTWTEADYKTDSIPFINYNLVMKYTVDNSSITLISTDTLSYSTTYKVLNQKIRDFGLNPEETSDFLFTIVASVSEASNVDDLSSSITLTLTAFDDTPPPANPIYLLGDATAAGWSNTAALEMTHVEAGTYEIIATLTGGGKYIKFIADLGQWAPQWGTDASGTWNSGPLVYRPTESVPDPAAIPAPPESGDYHILADTAQLTYQVEAVASKLFISTTDGYGEKIEMNKISPLIFKKSVTVTNKNKELYISFTDKQTKLVNSYINTIQKPAKGKTIFSEMDINSNGIIVPLPLTEGIYTFEINLYELTYSFKLK